MPAVIESGEQVALYPTEITHTDPKYKAGQTVPNWYGTPHVIAGLRRVVECREDWVPTAPGSEEGESKLVIEPTEWEYQLVRLDRRGQVSEWGWCKESEIDQYIAERE